MQFNNIFSLVFIVFFVLSLITKLILDLVNYKHREKYKTVIPPELDGYIDGEKMTLMNEYSNSKLVFSLIRSFFDKILLIVVLVVGIIPLVYGGIIAWSNNHYLVAYVFFGIIFLFQFIIDIPFSIYFNFVLEKKFEFNKMTVKTWFGDLLKKLLLSIILGIIILSALVFFLYTFEKSWWLLLWGFFLVFSLVLQVVYPTVIAPLFNKFKPLSNDELKDKIIKLLNKAGFLSSGVFEMDASKRSSHSNAYFTGIGKSKRIVLFDSLLEKHSDDEILGVLAHEIGHFKYKHILKSLIVSSLFSLASLFIMFILINNGDLYRGFGFKGTLDVERFKVAGILLMMIISSPIGFFFSPLSSFMSRKHEYQADKFAVKMMQSSEPLIVALKKLNIDNLSNIYPAKIYSWFYYSHPPLFERIRALKSIDI